MVLHDAHKYINLSGVVIESDKHPSITWNVLPMFYQLWNLPTFYSFAKTNLTTLERHQSFWELPTAERRVVNPFGFNAFTGSGDATATESNPYGKQDLDNPYIRENVNVFNKGGMVDKEMTYEGSGSFSELANRVIAKNQIKKIRQRFTNGGIF